MDRILEQRLFVGQEVTFEDEHNGAQLRGYVEQIRDDSDPALVTVRWTGSGTPQRVTLPEGYFQPAPRPELAQRMVAPRGAITRTR